MHCDCGLEGGGVVWTKAVHLSVTISGINITFKVYMYKVISCIAFTVQWCTIHTILIVGEDRRCCMDKSNAFVSHDIRESVGAAENIRETHTT